MRVIAGTARHLLLETPEGLHTRPTTDRTKETLFNMLNAYLPASDFLDLFSGSGGIGIEALSRGARSCIFVENDVQALSCIKHNLEHTHLADKATVKAGDVMTMLRRLNQEEKTFDFIFMDPPYRKDLEKEVLYFLSTSSLLNEDAWVIVEAAADTSFNYLDEIGFEIVKLKDYKTNMHLILRSKG